jgi:hypothetical protein
MPRPEIPVLLAVGLTAGAALAAGEEVLQTIRSQPSWRLRSNEVELAVTRQGGHMAPVTFFRGSRQPVQPYHISPWQDEKLKLEVPVLRSLRGDFFCLPFGGNGEAYQGENHPPHGETAGAHWYYGGTKKEGAITTLTLNLETNARSGKVSKQLSLVEGENVVYSRHLIEGFAGRTPLGHHATLAVPEKEGSVRIATSPFRLGMTNPSQFSNPEQKEYQSFEIGARFTDLRKVPLMWKGAPDADVTRLPARTGFADLLLIASEPASKLNGPAWVTATYPEDGYLWFSMKDPAVLASTVFWIENHGRHGSPWNGRNRCLGLEDVTAFFADGLAASAKSNVLNSAGVPTTLELTKDRPTAVNYIQGVARIPAGFDVVKTVQFAPGKATFTSESGKEVVVPVRHEFLATGRL